MRKSEREPSLPTSPFAFRFMLIMAPAFILAVLSPDGALTRLCRHTAAVAAYLLAGCGMTPELRGDTLSLGGFSIQVIPECTALYPGIPFGAFILAGPGSLSRKGLGLMVGIVLLHLLNSMRIAGVFALGVADPDLFLVAHVYLGQVIMVMGVIGACLLWQRWSAGMERRDSGRFLLRLTVCSGMAFLLWLTFNQAYVRLTDHGVRWIFALWDYRLIIPYQHTIYYQTFNLVIFIGLVLASTRSPLKRRLRILALGAGLIILLHLAFRICNVLMSGLHHPAVFAAAQMISLLGEYLIPVLAWYWLHLPGGMTLPGREAVLRPEVRGRKP